ncbi:hypothetical protein L5876_12025 [Hyphobacterium sp. SN044]|uniref:hypothetical protein n=1 Tax=Hyphobacterium sp. SN044 TaxID=2912575 RepID=UPI001F1D4F57|nr:hypothetical protein [Hyphobacterium sp. SN044]MCF8880544.1 hypothetical protein [Hyphobacterium sp. SN044]
MWTWIKTNHQALTAVGAMVVGLAALFVAWDQARVMRAQQHAAVYPVIQVDGFQSTTPSHASLGIRVRNTGVGPALIESVTLYQDGEERADLSSYLEQLPAGYDTSWAALTGRSMAAGEEVTPIELVWARRDIDLEDLISASQAWDHWEMEICYCSVFERCWRTSPLGGARAERVRHCVRADADPFVTLGSAAIDDPQAGANAQPDTESEPVETPVESQG